MNDKKKQMDFIKNFKALEPFIDTKNILINNLHKIHDSVYENYFKAQYNLSDKDYSTIKKSIDVINFDSYRIGKMQMSQNQAKIIIDFKSNYEKYFIPILFNI